MSAEQSAPRPSAAADVARNRRDFLRMAGLGGAALAITACADGAAGTLAPDVGEPKQLKPAVVTPGNVVLDFSMDVDILNYAYALEQLEAAFYTQVVANAAFGSIFAANEQRVLTDLRDHEIVHREFLKAALAADAIPALTPSFGAINFGDRTSVLTTARTFEDLGVGAYNGAGKYLKSGALLSLAGKIVSVEARHAAAIRDILAPRTGEFAPNAFDPALSPTVVLTAADPFIVENISVINA
jgi:rubrerythrin